MNGNYYNEFDAKAAAWLRELISAGLIPPGDVDERSITEVKPNEIKHYCQHHFFAGIGGFSLALKLAGWPEDRPIVTGSCPCQSFSSAGQQKGVGDHRDLWPVFAAIIRELRPATAIGEQVASAIRFGWLDRVRTDLEAEGYAVGGIVLGAHSVGAPHIRQRLYWVAHTGRDGVRRGAGCGEETGGRPCAAVTGSSDVERLAEPCGERFGRLNESEGQTSEGRVETDIRCANGRLADAVERGQRGGDERGLGAAGREMGEPQDGPGAANQPGHGCQDAEWMGESEQPRLEGHAGDGDGRNQPGRDDAGTARPVAETSRDGGGGVGESIGVNGAELARERSRPGETESTGEASPDSRPGSTNHWSTAIWLPCRDGKARRVKPGIPLLFARVPDRVVRMRGDRQPEIVAERCGEAAVMRLRGYGNSITVQVAAEFIKAYLNK